MEKDSFNGDKLEIDLFSFKYKKSDLSNAPEKDRIFFIMVTGLANELYSLIQMSSILANADENENNDIKRKGNSTLLMLLIRMSCGRLNEGWNTIRSFSKELKSDYESEMSQQGSQALKEIRKYFNPGQGKVSLIRQVRNAIAFHTLEENYRESFNNLDDETELTDYMTDTIGNTLFFSSQIVQFEILKNLTNNKDIDKAIKVLLDDTFKMISCFNRAIFAFAIVFSERYLHSSLSNLKDNKVTIKISKFDELKLEYFSQLPIPHS